MAQLDEISDEMAEKLRVSENNTAPTLSAGEPVHRPPSPQHGTTSIVYEPLVHGEAQVRFLTLHQGQFDEDIQCSLHTASLTTKPQYEALSYVWGNAGETLPVIVDGHEKQVTTNLEAALRHLRWQEKPRILWIDAICINQNDIEEKSAQVPMMGEVYRQAKSVIVWLGHGLSNVENAIKWANQHASKQAEDDDVIVDMCTVIWSCLILGLVHLLKHRYWHRMWTHQEFILATDTPICVYGHMTFSLATVFQAYKVLMRKYRAIYNDPRQSSHKKMSEIFSITLAELVEFASDMNHVLLLGRMAQHAKYEPPRPGELALLLFQSVNRESSDPRDRIYALYGLDPFLSRLLPVDYSKPEREVILEAIALMVRSRDPRLWNFFGLRADRFSCNRSFPSWAPNLDRLQQFEARARNLDILNSFVPAIAADHVSSDLATLHLAAWNLGHCKVLHRIHRHGNYGEQHNGLIHEFSAFVEGLWADKHDSKGHKLCQKFARCAVLGDKDHRQISDDGLVEAFRAVCSDPSLAENDHNGRFKTKELQLVARVGITLGDVACVVTSNGCVGFAPFDTQDNDLVVFPCVMRSPALVLRKEVSHLREAAQESYLMVGSANFEAAGVTEDEDFLTVVSKVVEIGLAGYLIH
ncbi:heterokaryon incompatibility protein-domain-containing protein [Pestalotiopsis sp. NC0098]|nr:heterokaryon incompatibility protein-domain-containing protein [Pestalotiopsis sp. NC0098]